MVTGEELRATGLSRSAIRWGERQGRWRAAGRDVYVEGTTAPSSLEEAVAAAYVADAAASGCLAGVLLGLDSVRFVGHDMTSSPGSSTKREGVRRRVLSPDRVITIGQIRCTDGVQTLVDLAAELDDDTWEQALESALRKGIATIEELESSRNARVRRVLATRPADAPPTESLLETLMVQLARRVPGLPSPQRQVVVRDAEGRFVARVDLAWPELGVFVELDGQHHLDQPVHDARRETAVVAATGWLCARFTWHEVAHVPSTTVRRLREIADRAAARPVSPV